MSSVAGDEIRPGDPPFRVGERFERSLHLDAEAIRTFATLVGDTNPLHHDAALAARSRFGALIASGTHTSALIMAVVADAVTARCPSLGLETACQFKRAVTAGTRLAVTWTIVAITPKPGLHGHILALEGEARDADGALYVTAQSISLVLREN